MAKNGLTIVPKVGVGTISPDGYANIIQKLVIDASGLDDFEDLSETERADQLQEWAEAAGAEAKQLDAGNTDEKIEAKNCKVLARKDKRKKVGPKKRSIVTVALPEDTLSQADLNPYIDNYVKAFMKLYDPSYTWPTTDDNNDKKKARRYMLGVFLMTRCR